MSFRGRNTRVMGMIPSVSAGAPVTWQMDLDRRYLRNVLNCQAINYTGGTGLATTKLTGSGNNNLTVTPTIVRGGVSSVAVVAGGTGYTTGDTVTINDATGTGFVGTVTASGGIVSAVAVTVQGTPSPISPAVFFDYLRIKVNGKTMRDITPLQWLMIATAKGYYSQLGELPIDYVDPERNFVNPNDSTAWDVMPGSGVVSMQFEAQVDAAMQSPVLQGWSEFDFLQNTVQNGNQIVRVANPIKYRQISDNIPIGLYDFVKIPRDEPIQRLWIIGSNPGNLSRIELIADNTTRLEGQPVQRILDAYQRYGFQFGKPNYLNRNIGSNTVLQGQYNPINYFDAAFLPDVDGRLSDALAVASQLTLRVTSAVAQTLTVVVESAPGAFK